MKLFALVLTASVALTSIAGDQRPAPGEPLFEKFFSAETPADAEAMAEQFASFDPDAVFRRLKQGSGF